MKILWACVLSAVLSACGAEGLPLPDQDQGLNRRDLQDGGYLDTQLGLPDSEPDRNKQDAGLPADSTSKPESDQKLPQPIDKGFSPDKAQPLDATVSHDIAKMPDAAKMPDQGVPLLDSGVPFPDQIPRPPDYGVPDTGGGDPDYGGATDQGVAWPCQPGCQIDGACVGLYATKPGNSCLHCDPYVTWAGWSNRPGSCNDGNDCTHTDQCVKGSCKGTTYSCDDGLTCTQDWCNGDGTCGQVQAWGCAIDGVCYPDGAKHPKSNCYKCDSSKSATEWTLVATTAGDSCSSNSQCAGLVCIGATDEVPGICSCACKVGGPCPMKGTYTQLQCKATALSGGQLWCQ